MSCLSASRSHIPDQVPHPNVERVSNDPERSQGHALAASVDPDRGVLDLGRPALKADPSLRTDWPQPIVGRDGAISSALA